MPLIPNSITIIIPLLIRAKTLRYTVMHLTLCDYYQAKCWIELTSIWKITRPNNNCFYTVCEKHNTWQHSLESRKLLWVLKYWTIRQYLTVQKLTKSTNKFMQSLFLTFRDSLVLGFHNIPEYSKFIGKWVCDIWKKMYVLYVYPFAFAY